MAVNTYANIKKSAGISQGFWDTSQRAGLIDIVASGSAGGRHRTAGTGHEFVNMSSYSYLGLDTHPRIVAAAAQKVLEVGALNSSTSRIRLRFDALKDAEDALSDLWDAETVTVNSCAAAAWATLPLLASGLLTDGRPPVMAFDKNAHFCLNAMKASAADEAPVVTIGHNDVEALEDLCRKHPLVAYVADGVYSTGGQAPVDELLRLQERYGLFLFFDEAHGTSTTGVRGRGLVLERMGAINDRTLIITSLNKGFGASGGAILLGRRGRAGLVDTALRSGGPLMWSQRINTAGIGALLASAELHRTDELTRLQRDLRDNIELFDSLVTTRESGDGLPIRFVSVGSEQATVELSRTLLREGYYTSPLFFPIIARGRAGLRVMLRADLTRTDIEEFGALIAKYAPGEDTSE